MLFGISLVTPYKNHQKQFDLTRPLTPRPLSLPAAPTCSSIANKPVNPAISGRISAAPGKAKSLDATSSNGEVLRETPTTAVISVAIGEKIELACGMAANPRKGLEFRWTLNSSAATSEGEKSDLSKDRFTSRGSRSLLTYTPRSALDYGTIMCRASNEVGETAKEPCVYHVIPAGLYITFLVLKQSAFVSAE